VYACCLALTQAALQDLGMLDGKRPDEIRTMVKQHMRMADAAAAARGDGVGFDAFCRFYETVVMAKARQQLRFKLGLQVEGTKVSYCRGGWCQCHKSCSKAGVADRPNSTLVCVCLQLVYT
jgi:hypothetical protein